MIKGSCSQSVVPRYGEKFQFFWAVTVPILINREDVVTFILGNLSPIFWNAFVLRIFVPGIEEDRPKDSEKWSWVKNAWSVELCLVRRGWIIQLTSFPGYWSPFQLVKFKVPLGRKFIGLFRPNSVPEYRVVSIFPQKTEQQTFHPNIF